MSRDSARKTTMLMTRRRRIMKRLCLVIFVLILGRTEGFGVVARRRIRSPVLRRAVEETELESVWSARRSLARQAFKTKVLIENGAKEAKKAEEEARLKELEDGEPNELAESARSTVASTVFGVVFVALILRFGGRAALLEFLGMNTQADTELSSRVNEVLNWKAALPGGEVAAFGMYLVLWTGAKTLCIDALAFVLALASGVIFGGLVQGALVSSTCAALGSSLPFLISRTSDLRPKVLTLARRSPRTRALESAVSDRGLVTVLALRLAPVIPIPLGAYNYLYGATSIPYQDFLLGTFLGSLKPYAFDAYLGLLGRDVVDAAATGSSQNGLDDPALLAVFAAFFAVGALASDQATRIWDAIELELSDETQAQNQVEEEENGILDDRDWIDVLELRDTPPWRAAASVSNLALSNEPQWSTRLRKRSRRARYALASMSQQELALCRYLVDRGLELDQLTHNEIQTFSADKPPPGADTHYNIKGSLVESIFFTYVLARALYSEDTMAAAISYYKQIEGDL